MQPAARTQPPGIAADPGPDWATGAAVRVRRYLRCLRCPRDVVDDVVQDALLAAVRADATAPPPLPWLLTVARNRWLELCRRQRPGLVASIDALDLRAREALGDDGGDARVAALRACVDTLPARSREALRLCYGDADGNRPLPRSEAARRLGLGDNGLKSLLARLRASLEQCIERRRQRDG